MKRNHILLQRKNRGDLRVHKTERFAQRKEDITGADGQDALLQSKSI